MGSLFLDKYDLSKLPRMTMKEAFALNEKEGYVPMELPEEVLNGEKKIILDYVDTDENNRMQFGVSYQK